MYIIIAGCRKVGSSLALELSQENHDVVVIDSDPKNFEPLGSGFNGLTITGMPIDEDILRSAGIERADALAAVTNDDNMNVMVSQIAKEMFKVPVVITRVYDPQREEVFRKMGLDIICPTTLAVDRIKNRLLPKIKQQTFEFGESNVTFKYIRPAKKLIGKKVSEIAEQNVLGLIRNDEFTLAYPKTNIEADDILIVSEYLR